MYRNCESYHILKSQPELLIVDPTINVVNGQGAFLIPSNLQLYNSGLKNVIFDITEEGLTFDFYDYGIYIINVSFNSFVTDSNNTGITGPLFTTPLKISQEILNGEINSPLDSAIDLVLSKQLTSVNNTWIIKAWGCTTLNITFKMANLGFTDNYNTNQWKINIRKYAEFC